MSGDYTRLTFRPERLYSSVRLQQGRVQVDADWNEAEDIALHLDRITTSDVVGRTGVPQEAPGFALIAADPDDAGAASDLLIGFGRAYVDGILVENLLPAQTTLTAVGEAPGTFLVAAGPLPRLGEWLVRAEGSEILPARVTALPAAVAEDNGLTRITLSPAPAGATVTMTIVPSLIVQPDFFDDLVPQVAGLYGVFLEVHEREVTALDDPLLRETALGGPDTCLRTQIVWRVGIDASGTSCKDYPPGWAPDPSPRARLSAEGVPATADDDPCLTPDPGGYRGLENHLYRVEVHRSGDVEAGQVLVKWSRDNAIQRTRFTLSAERLRVDSLGRDDATALDQGQWVEVQDEARWRQGLPGHMVRLGEVNGTEIAIAEIRDPVTNLALTEADGDPQVAVLPAVGLLRRWEGGPPVAAAADTPLALESGIEVTLSEGRLSAGDWWTIPARTLTADVEWPADPATGAALAVPPQAVARHYMALGIIERTAQGRLLPVSDCRRIFPPLTSLITFEMLGGDGQEELPNLTPGAEGTLVPLAAPFRVGVSRGTTPIEGRLVRFTTADSNPGRLEPVPGTPPQRVLRANPTDLIIATDPTGVAEARFSIHGLRTDYTVEARLLDASDPDRADPIHLPIRFFAAAEIASEVAFDPRNCLYQRTTPGEARPARTVQEAIDRLCPQIQLVMQGGDGQVALPGQPLPSPLRVGALWGGRPLAGARLRFERLTGDATPPNADLTTGADGTASLVVRAGANAAQDNGIITYRVSGLAFPQTPWPASLQFTARFASGGSAEPPPRLRIIDVFTVADPPRPLTPNTTLTPDIVARGFRVTLDSPVDPIVERSWFAGEVWIDVPTDAVGVTAGGPHGGVAFRPDGQLRVGESTTGRRDVLIWEFTQGAQDWIRRALPSQITRFERQLATARFVINGGAVFGTEQPPRWLDGLLLFQGAAATPLRPSGIGVAASDMVMPFRIGRG